MPYKSKSQQRKFFAMESRGDVPEGTARRWAHETPNIKRLPEKLKDKKKKKKRSKKASLELAFDLGRKRAFEEAGLKTAGALGKTLGGTKHLWIPGLAGSYFAGPENRLEGALLGLAGGALGRHYGLKAMRRAFFSPEELKILAKLKSSRKLEKGAPELFKQFEAFKAQKPIIELAASGLGGAGAGYLANKAFSPSGPFGGTPSLPATPAVSDMATHYAGLVPGEEYYI
jgi:hypothetical protein